MQKYLIIYILLSLCSIDGLIAQITTAEKAIEEFKRLRKVDLDSALYFAELSTNLALQLRDTSGLITGLSAVGYVELEKGYYVQSLETYKRAARLAERVSHYRLKYIYGNIGSAFMYYSQYDSALIYNFKSLKIKEMDGDKPGMASSNNNIGLIYYNLRDYSRAISYLKRALSLYNELKLSDKDLVLCNIGLAYQQLDDYDVAKNYYYKALKFCEDGCGVTTRLQAFSGLGAIYEVYDSLELAGEYYKRVRDLSIEFDYDKYYVTSNYRLAELFFKQRAFQDALDYLDQSESKAKNTENRLWLGNAKKLRAEIYAAQNKFEEAYGSQTEYIELADSLWKREIIQNIANAQLEQVEEKNKQIIAVKDSELSKKSQINLLLALVIILIVTVLVIMYFNMRHRAKINKKLALAYETIEHQNEELTTLNSRLEEKVKERTRELRASNTALYQSNKDLDTFIYKTSHDIRGPLATLQGVCNIALMDVEEPVSVDYFQKLNTTAGRLNEILSKLQIINQLNNAKVEKQRIQIHDLIEQILVEARLKFPVNEVNIKLNIPDTVDLHADQVILHVILRNLIFNAFKFYNSSERIKSFMGICVKNTGKNYKIAVIDNGIGINPDQKDRIFDIFSKASEIQDSSGIGLYLVKLAIEKLEGKIDLTETDEGFTKFVVTLPH